MKRTPVAFAGILGLLLCLSAVTLAERLTADQSKPWAQARTPDGQPDLQGVWLNNTATPFERPDALKDRPALTDEEVSNLQSRADRIFKDGRSDFPPGIDNLFLAALSDVDTYRNPASTENSLDMVRRVFENRTSLIVDPANGRLPPLTAEAQAQRRPQSRQGPANPEELNAFQRCITVGVPAGSLYTPPYGYFEILQARGYVVLSMEILTTRIVPLDGRPHLSDRVRQWDGDPRGRWDGSTLVVDTTNFSKKSNFQGSSDHLHLIERFTRTGPDSMTYLVTAEDPTRWIRPWTAEIHLARTDQNIYEFACHEGNYDTVRTILNSARASE